MDFDGEFLVVDKIGRMIEHGYITNYIMNILERDVARLGGMVYCIEDYKIESHRTVHALPILNNKGQ